MNSNRDQQPGLIPTAITHIPAASVCMQEMVPKYNNGSAQLLGHCPWKSRTQTPTCRSPGPLVDIRLRPCFQHVFLRGSC